MNVAFLSTFYPFRGGIAQFNAALYRQIAKHHTASAYTFTRQYPDILFPGETQFVTDGDAADPIPATQILDTINPLSWRRTAARISRDRPDLLLMKFWMPFFAPSLGTIARRVRRNGSKVITVLDNVIPHEKRPGDTALIRYFLRQNDGFVAMSQQVADDLTSLAPDAKFIVKPHPIYDHFGPAIDAASARQQLGLPPDGNILLFFGFIRGYKGLDLLIEAMRELPEDFHLVIAGEVYGDFAPYQQRIEASPARERIVPVIRYIDDHEVPLFFSAADVAVLPYTSATQSGIAQIAYHYALPLIATDVGGLAEMVVDEVTGLLVPEARPAAIAAAVRRCFEEDRCESFSKAIAARRESLSWSGFAESILELYDTLPKPEGQTQ